MEPAHRATSDDPSHPQGTISPSRTRCAPDAPSVSPRKIRVSARYQAWFEALGDETDDVLLCAAELAERGSADTWSYQFLGLRYGEHTAEYWLRNSHIVRSAACGRQRRLAQRRIPRGAAARS